MSTAKKSREQSFNQNMKEEAKISAALLSVSRKQLIMERLDLVIENFPETSSPRASTPAYKEHIIINSIFTRDQKVVFS